MWMELRSYHHLATFLSVIAAALLIACCAAPIWIYLDPDDNYVGLGLFNRAGWDEDDSTPFPVPLTDIKYLEEQTQDCSHWLALIGLEVTATALACFLVPLLYYYQNRYKPEKNLHGNIQTILGLTFFAWICNVLGLIIFALYHGDVITEGPHINSESFSWAAMMAFFAATIHFWIFYIVYIIFPKADINLPSAADPRFGQYPATKNAVMNRFLEGAPYANERLPIEDDFARPEPRLSIMPADDLVSDRRELISVPMVQRMVVDNNADRYQPVVRELGNRQSINTGRTDLRNATVIQARDMDEVNGGEEDIVFRRVGETRGNRDLETAEYIVKRPSGDFVIPAKHGADRDAYPTERYLVHTTRPTQDVSDAQRLVLSPSNFTETNVKHNPSYMYRPYSERVY